jgi:hypothetical protein
VNESFGNSGQARYDVLRIIPEQGSNPYRSHTWAFEFLTLELSAFLTVQKTSLCLPLRSSSSISSSRVRCETGVRTFRHAAYSSSGVTKPLLRILTGLMIFFERFLLLEQGPSSSMTTIDNRVGRGTRRGGCNVLY